MTRRPTPRVTSATAVEGIRKGMTEDELRARFNLPAGSHTTALAFPLGFSRAQLHGTMEKGRLLSFEVTLE